MVHEGNLPEWNEASRYGQAGGHYQAHGEAYDVETCSGECWKACVFMIDYILDLAYRRARVCFFSKGKSNFIPDFSSAHENGSEFIISLGGHLVSRNQGKVASSGLIQ